MKNRTTVSHILLACALVVQAAADCEEKWDFDCGNGQCIQPHKLCDGDYDCNNHADERECTAELLVCPPCSFACRNQAQCVKPSWVCDGDYDCRGGSDEKYCPEARFAALNCSLSTRPKTTGPTCGVGHFLCPDGLCLREVQVCDGVKHCTDGDDEAAFCLFYQRGSHHPQEHRQDRRGWLVDIRVQFRALFQPLLNPHNITSEE